MNALRRQLDDNAFKQTGRWCYSQTCCSQCCSILYFAYSV